MYSRLDWTGESSSSLKPQEDKTATKGNSSTERVPHLQLAFRSREEPTLSHKVMNWSITAGAGKPTEASLSPHPS